MAATTDIAIIGAGPYGLSLAAHLLSRGLSVRVFGQPMRFWKTCMPDGMVLKSEGFASDLWHPHGAFTLRDYCAEAGLPYKHSGLPVPLQTFCDYGDAFQKRFVPGLDTRSVTALEHRADQFELRLDDNAVVTASRVVVAAGIGGFPFVPQELADIKGKCVHSTQVKRLDGYAGKQVLVIGGGASGVELAGLLSKKGARVTVATRQDRIAFCGAPALRSLWQKLKAPETGLGTGWRSWACVYAPMVFYSMPRAFRHLVVRKHLGPAPGWTSRNEVERNVNLLTGASPARSTVRSGRACVTFRCEDGSEKTVEADDVIAATGFKVDIGRLPFLGRSITDRLKLSERTPELSRHFESSVPGLFFVGVAAANNFGPLLRFAYGAGFASNRLSKFLARSAVRRPSSNPAPTKLAPA